MTRDGTHFTKAYFLSSQGKKKPMERKSRGRSQRVSMGIPENRGKLRTSGNRVRRPGSSSGNRRAPRRAQDTELAQSLDRGGSQ